MKTLTAILLASSMAISAAPAALAQNTVSAASVAAVHTRLDGATVEQSASATAAAAVYVDNGFTSSMAPPNIGDIRAALRANASLDMFFAMHDFTVEDVVGVSAQEDAVLLVFVATDMTGDAKAHNSLLATINTDGSVIVDGDIAGELDGSVESSVDANSTTTVKGSTGSDIDANAQSTGGDEASTSVDGAIDVDVNADAAAKVNS